MPSRTIDWKAIHKRLDMAAAAISEGFDPAPEEIRRVLDTRARKAARPELKPDTSERIEILSFSMAGEIYGIETCHIREVCQIKELTVVPCTPPFIAGVMNLRGRILTIVDLCRFFKLPPGGLTEFNRVIVLKGSDNELGVLADSISGVLMVAVSELQENLPTLTGIHERFLRGVTAQVVAVLDGERLLGDNSLKVNEKVNIQIR